MDNRKVRDKEPPTLAFRLKPYKAAIQQLRCIIRSLKDNTTVSFLPTPALVVQTVRSHFVSKITFNNSCLYITDKCFPPKTINNVIPLIGNFMYLTSNRDLTKFSVQDISDLSAKICMSAPDYNMEFSSACVHGQDIIRESGESSARVDLDVSIVLELIKWISPHIRPKRNAKKQTTSTSTVQILIHANPPTVKFALGGSSELEFTANSRIGFHEVKNLRVTVQAKNLHQALTNCAVTKLACTLRVINEHDVMVYVASKNATFSIENFLTEEPFGRSESTFERSTLSSYQGSAQNQEDFNSVNNDMSTVDVVPRKHDRSCSRKSDDHVKEKYDQYKITNFMTAKSNTTNAVPERGGNYFSEAKEESDSDESVTFEYTPNTKKQKCL
nr:MAG: protein m44 [Herpesviridae sp.]